MDDRLAYQAFFSCLAKEWRNLVGEAYITAKRIFNDFLYSNKSSWLIKTLNVDHEAFEMLKRS
jgi:hypothetical protein